MQSPYEGSALGRSLHCAEFALNFREGLLRIVAGLARLALEESMCGTGTLWLRLLQSHLPPSLNLSLDLA